MMSRKLFAGFAAFGIYIAVLAILFYYFGFHQRNGPQHFVKKSENGIEVTLAGAKAVEPSHRTKRSSVKRKRHPKPRNITQKKQTPKKTPAKKRVPSKPKKPNTKRLFSKVKLPQKKEQKKSGALGTKNSPQKSIKKNTKEQGVENSYLAKVESLLRGWPAQVNFAGQEIDVWLKIYPSGRFEYRVLKLSNNPDFNHELISYLKQLQRIGFGSHNRQKPYEIEVQFIAHE